MQVVEFGLAVNHKFRTKDGQDREEVMFIDCSCFGKGAEVINTYCQKGKPLLVEGRLKLDTWEDKQGGGKRSKHTVQVDNFQLLGSRDDRGGDDNDSGQTIDRSTSQDRPPRGPSSSPPKQQSSAPPAIPDDEIPF